MREGGRATRARWQNEPDLSGVDAVVSLALWTTRGCLSGLGLTSLTDGVSCPSGGSRTMSRFPVYGGC